MVKGSGLRNLGSHTVQVKHAGKLGYYRHELRSCRSFGFGF